MATLIDGKKIAEHLVSELKKEAEYLKMCGVEPKLTVILVGEDPASAIYVKNKEKTCHKAGITSVVLRLPADTAEADLLAKIDELNNDSTNHGILVQLPVPKHINADNVLLAIDPCKDVDGFHPINMGKLVSGQECLQPCTPAGIMHLIRSTGIEISGKDAVIVGRSNIVGKPVALMLLKENATVTVCHSKTTDLSEKIRAADIVIAAIGRPEFIRADWIKKGAIVIDVGINRTENGKIVGDVQFEFAKENAAFITPVPGGVGPMTIAMLLKNTIEVAKRGVENGKEDAAL